MRISTWFRLAVLCLLAGGIQAAYSQAPAPPKPPASKKVIFEETFKGHGMTLKEAEARALERACEATQKHFGWSPSPDYLRDKGMVELVGQPTEKVFEFAKDLTKDSKLTVVTLKLEITADQARELQKQGQHQRMKERQKFSLLGLIGAVGLLGIVAGYLRVEEATKGYFTRRLRIAAITILLLIVAGLCVIA